MGDAVGAADRAPTADCTNAVEVAGNWGAEGVGGGEGSEVGEQAAAHAFLVFGAGEAGVGTGLAGLG